MTSFHLNSSIFFSLYWYIPGVLFYFTISLFWHQFYWIRAHLKSLLLTLKPSNLRGLNPAHKRRDFSKCYKRLPLNTVSSTYMYCDLENTYLFPKKEKMKRCGFDLQAVSSIKVNKYSSHTFTHFFPQIKVFIFRIRFFSPFLQGSDLLPKVQPLQTKKEKLSTSYLIYKNKARS